MNAEEAPQPEAVAETAQGLSALGSALPGTDPDRFAEAKANFIQEEEPDEGLGPLFNDRACGNCHNTPATGGSGIQIERRFGSVQNGKFYAYDQPHDDEGGTLRQLFSNGDYEFNGKACNAPVESEPADATIHNVGRRSLPLFGLGLVDAMPDGWFDFLAAIEPAERRGTVTRSLQNFPDSRDPAQGLNKTRVHRFGIKGQQTNLVSFAGDAYLNEMGITTQSCFKGSPILAFANENLPNGKAFPAGCNGGDLKLPNPPGNPNIPEFTDDAVGDCSGGVDEVQDDMANFLFFMEHLAPPAPDLSDPISAGIGGVIFAAIGCGDCHTLLPFVTPSHPFNGVPGNYVFFPFSDFLTHDMGSLGDKIGNTGDSIATTRQMRTAPLWGTRFNTQLLHDGRAHNVREAVLAHDGQGLQAKKNFAALGAGDQNFVIKFVNSL
jgi:CxxC motif-containing protein (DUF1111 family)